MLTSFLWFGATWKTPLSHATSSESDVHAWPQQACTQAGTRTCLELQGCGQARGASPYHEDLAFHRIRLSLLRRWLGLGRFRWRRRLPLAINVRFHLPAVLCPVNKSGSDDASGWVLSLTQYAMNSVQASSWSQELLSASDALPAA